MHLIFQNQTFCLDLTNSISYKKKKNLIDLITQNGGKVSFILKKDIDYLIKDDKTSLDTYKCRTAFKLNVPVIHSDYVFCASAANHETEKHNPKDFAIQNELNIDNLKSGKISKGKKRTFLVWSKFTIDLNFHRKR
jgi:hypothetical protein